MKLSGCQPTFEAIVESRGQVLVDLPNSDELRVLRDWEGMERFVAEFGDWDCGLSDWGRRLSIPAFEKGRAKAMELKAKWCEQHGSE